MEYLRDVTYPDTESAPGVWYAIKGSTFTFRGDDYIINESSSGYKNTQFAVLSNNPAESQPGWISYETWNDTNINKEKLFENWNDDINYKFDTGVHTIVYRGIDNVNNISNEKSFTFFVDFLPPIFDLNIAGNYLEKSPTYYYLTSGAAIDINVHDDFSGVNTATLNIKLNNNEISSPFTVTTESTNSLEIYCKDLNGNTGYASYTLFVDNIPPDIIYDIGMPKQESDDKIIITPYTPIDFSISIKVIFQ